MATLALSAKGISAERGFFLTMALVFEATVLAGFGLNFGLGRVNGSTLPPLVYLHGLAFLGWITLYVAQCWLVNRGAIAQHRKLGVFGSILTAVMVPLGVIVTVEAIQRGAVPFFFTTNIFLVVNTMGILFFGGFVAAAVALRKKPDWHRRLMFCAALELIAPAFGRLLPMPLFGPTWGYWAITCAFMVYAVIGILFDLKQRKSVHPAWWTGVAIILLETLSFAPIAFTPYVQSLATHLAGK